MFYVKRQLLKGNAFHCVRTFHLLRLLCEFSLSTPLLESVNIDVLTGKECERFYLTFLKELFTYIAAYTVEQWQALVLDFVPSLYFSKLQKCFLNGVEVLDTTKNIQSLFDIIEFPPDGWKVVKVQLESDDGVLLWQLSTFVNAKLG